MLWRYVQLGGPMMWPLIICSILLTAVLVERLWQLGIKHRLLGSRLRGEQLSWHRRVLPFFTDVPPSLGLLGTVVGVVQSFQLANGQVNGEAVGAGLGVACMTTVFGLGIGVIASISGYLFDWAAGVQARNEASGEVQR